MKLRYCKAVVFVIAVILLIAAVFLPALLPGRGSGKTASPKREPSSHVDQVLAEIVAGEVDEKKHLRGGPLIDEMETMPTMEPSTWTDDHM